MQQEAITWDRGLEWLNIEEGDQPMTKDVSSNWLVITADVLAASE
jgi:hypothetical protein